MQYYGLIFDVDGVIADTEAVNAEATAAVFADLFGCSGVRRADFEAGLGRGAHEYIRAAARVHHLELTDTQVETAARERQERFLQILQDHPLPAFPGVLALIDAALKSACFRVAIATSSTREKSQAVLRAARIPFEDMAYLTGSEIRNKKPHPELFLKAAQALDLPPSRCVVIEDAPNGIEAARAAGCQCVAVTNSTSSDKLIRAHRIVSTLEELDLEAFKQMLQDEG